MSLHLRDEAGGNEPDMLKLIELMHTNKKTGVKDKKVVQITETVRSQVNQIASQRQTQGEGPMTQAEINAVVVRRLVDNMHMSFPCNSNAAQGDHEQLREEVKTLKKIQIEKDAQIKFLLNCNKLFLDKLGICPPSPLSSPMDEDESETQEKIMGI
ncbi:unnamed protein product [Microthlaspi erraticum]|uniref:Uncharacterized protein n=1 Tax=Microthlaspi erraticum TaxID=1685480 RepID=A0A6D2HF45_9BRAS|nr:unnamed protein product [Microthlaspi erraticum]